MVEAPAVAPAGPAPDATGAALGSARHADTPLAPVHASFRSRVVGDTGASIQRVRTLAAARRTAVAASFAAQRGRIDTVMGAGSSRVLQTASAAVERVAGWVTARITAVHSAVAGAVDWALRTGAQVGQAVQAAVNRVTGAIAGVVNGAVAGILRVAHAVPIPDVRLIRGIRSRALGVADRIGAAVTRAVDGVRDFVQSVVSHVIVGILGVLARVGAGLLSVLQRIVAALLRAVAGVRQKVDAAVAWLCGVLRSAHRSVLLGLRGLEMAALAQISRSEARAVRELQDNREHSVEVLSAVMDFAYAAGDYPPDDGAAAVLGGAEQATTQAAFHVSVTAAMGAAVSRLIHDNARVVARLESVTATLLAVVRARVLEVVAGMAAWVARGIAGLVAELSAAVAQVVEALSNMVRQVVSALRAVVNQVRVLVERVVQIVVDVVREPVEALLRLASGIAKQVWSFVTGLVNRLVAFFSGSDSDGASSVTSAFDGFTPGRLAAAARMASPPAAVAAVLVAGVGITAAMVWTALMWIAVIGIILLLLYLVYKLVVWARSRPQAVPRTVPKEATKEPKRRDRRRPKRQKRRLFWNAALPNRIVQKSGGIVGTLDTDFRGGLFHLEGHHVWPRYVGGPAVQPLMSLRFEVHRLVVHPGLHVAMATAAVPMGFTLVINRTNGAFIRHLRRTPTDRAVFAGVMLAFYAGVGAAASPPVPPAAYVPGLALSAAAL